MRYRDDGFHGTLTAQAATHRFNPSAHPNANADVESSHATIEPGLFDLETFSNPDHFLAAVTTYQHFFNFARKNRSRRNLTPAKILALRSPHFSPQIMLLPPLLLRADVVQHLSGPPRAGRPALDASATLPRLIHVKPRRHRCQSVLAACLAACVWLLALATHAPRLHSALCEHACLAEHTEHAAAPLTPGTGDREPTADASADHRCAITLFAAGCTTEALPFTLAPPAAGATRVAPFTPWMLTRTLRGPDRACGPPRVV